MKKKQKKLISRRVDFSTRDACALRAWDQFVDVFESVKIRNTERRPSLVGLHDIRGSARHNQSYHTALLDHCDLFLTDLGPMLVAHPYEWSDENVERLMQISPKPINVHVFEDVRASYYGFDTRMVITIRVEDMVKFQPFMDEIAARADVGEFHPTLRPRPSDLISSLLEKRQRQLRLDLN